MPEVAKCPCCKNEMLPLLTVTGCSYCAFECELKDFTRISAAIEFTRWVSKQHHSFSRTLSTIIKKANEALK